MPDGILALVGGSVLLTIVLICGSFLLTAVITVGAFVLVRRAFMPNHKVMAEGVSGQATIVQVQQTGAMVNYQPQATLTLNVEVPGWEPYQVVTKMVIPIVNVPQFQPGAVVPVKVDPNDKNKVVLDVYG